MSTEPSSAPRSPLRRLRAGRGVLAMAAATGGAVAAAVILNPLADSSAQAASELTRFSDCDALADHMRELALARLDSYEQLPVRDDPLAFPLPADPGPPGAPARGLEGELTAVPRDGAAATAPQAPTDVAPDGAGASAQAAERGSSEPATTSASPADAVGPDQRGTNTQEAGVDEADLAKTDGHILVTISGGTLEVMDVRGDTPRRRGHVDLPGQKPVELLLSGDRAVVIGNAEQTGKFGIRPSEAGGAFDRRSSNYAIDSTTISVIDLSNADRPLVRSSEEVTARYLSARMVDDTVRLVFSSTPLALPSFDTRGADVLREGIEGAAAQDWLPTRRTVNREARTVSESPLVDCSDVRYPSVDSGLDLVTVLSLDAGEGDLGSALSTAIVGNGDLVYASADRLFVATTDGGWGGGSWGPTPAALSGAQQRVSPGAPALAPAQSPSTVSRIHSFDITGAGAEYEASGTVTGYLYGRWAMSERDGLLRVVTTSTAPWNSRFGGVTETGVSVLETVGDRMRVIGAVGNMGLTETVRAVRWFDDVAAIVTFRQSDPLYLVDLSNPQAPRLRGELKIPGYSAYLHPIGEHRLLGVGQDADEFGQTLGLQMSSFDILDLADPRRSDALGFGRGTSSPVETDPRGFVYLPLERVAVFPVLATRVGCDARAADAGTFVCRFPDNPADLGFAPNERGRSTSGLVAVGVDQRGQLTPLAGWNGREGRDVVKVLPLPGGRLVALDTAGVTILRLDGLRPTGSARFR
ncbi:MAG: beta-propeller domain-containing protein [Sporichthyaceae bacterium]